MHVIYDSKPVTMQMNDSHVIYKNQIMTRNSSLNETITHKNQVEIDFSCSFKQPDTQSVSNTIKNRCVEAG